MNGMVIKQLKKALECKDDKELRLRVEVLLDMLEEQQSPFSPGPTMLLNQTKKKKQPQVQGPGAIMSPNGEQLNYLRPPNT